MFTNHKLLASAALLVAITMAAPALADVLIYWDQTPNSEIDLEAARFVAEQRDEEVTLVTDAQALARELEYPGWSSVVIVKEHASELLGSAEALADYADYYGNVYWKVWLDRGGRNLSVAYSTWWRGRTTVGYAGMGSRSAWTVDGYNIPDFAHVNVDDHVAPATPEPRFGALRDEVDDCKDDCLTTFGDDVIACDGQRDVDYANCNAAYPDHGDDWEECYDNARNDHNNCEKAAHNRLKTCLALCDAENEGPLGDAGSMRQSVVIP